MGAINDGKWSLSRQCSENEISIYGDLVERCDWDPWYDEPGQCLEVDLAALGERMYFEDNGLCRCGREIDSCTDSCTDYCYDSCTGSCTEYALSVIVDAKEKKLTIDVDVAKE